MRELALVLPGDVWLIGLTATRLAGVSLEGGGGVSGRRAGAGSRSSAGTERLRRRPGGGRRLRHRAQGHRRGDPGRRRSSELAEEEEAVAATKSAPTRVGGDECRTREFIAKFAIVVAFDAAPVPAGSEEAEAATGRTGEVEDSRRLRRSRKADEMKAAD